MSPTGPAPKMATDSPAEKWERVRPCQPVGKMSARRAKEDSCAEPGGRGRALKSAKGTRRYCAWAGGEKMDEADEADEGRDGVLEGGEGRGIRERGRGGVMDGAEGA